MALSLNQKKAVIEEVSSIVAQAQSVIVAEYTGLSVAKMTELRQKASELGVKLKVVKNTLAKRAFSDTDYSCMNEVLTGQVVLAFSQESLGGAARVCRDFAKENKMFKVTGLSLGDGLLDASKLKDVADLPNYQEALSMLLGVMKAPIEKLVRTLVEPAAKVTRVVAAVRDQKA